MSFKDAWPDKVWKHIEAEFNTLKEKRPVSQETGAVGCHWGSTKVANALQTTGELRNVACNLTWTPPLEFAPTMDQLSFDMVEKFAKKTWHPDPPGIWPRGMNIPIACMCQTSAPEKLQMKRYGLDLVVCSFWLALAWAVEQKQTAQKEKLLDLACNCPFDFKYFRTEADVFLGAANLLESNELMREYFGFDSQSLVRVVMQTKKMLSSVPDGKSDAGSVSEYLRKNISWADPRRAPSKETVEHALGIGAMLAKAPRAQLVLEKAKVRFGRSTLFDEYTKLLLCTQKAANSVEFEFLVEGLYVFMLRTPDYQQSSAEMKSKSGDVQALLFMRRYFAHLLKKYPLAGAGPEQQHLLNKALAILASPLTWWEECCDVDPASMHWIAGLPEIAKLILTHVRAVFEGRFNEALKGLLGSPPTSGATPEAFLKIEKVKAQFLDEVEKAVIRNVGADTTACLGEMAGSNQLLPATSAGGKASLAEPEELEKDIQNHAQELLAQRVILLQQKSTSGELLAALQDSPVFKALSNERRMCAVYDPKNARLARTYGGDKEKGHGKQNWLSYQPTFRSGLKGLML